MIFGAGVLAQRRAEALERCASLRASIAADAAPVAAKAQLVDRIVTTVRAHPVLAMLTMGAVGGLLPRLLPSWIARALILYSILRKK